MPKITVIMSVRNGGRDLHTGIPSILNQTFRDFEFIICDDGSTDDTFILLKEYQMQDKRIVILRNEESKGLAYSLNRCIEIAQSNILARQDADDTSALNRFELQYPFVCEHPEYAIVGTCWNNIFSDGHEVKNPIKELPTALDQVKGGLYMHPSWMMRKDQLEKVGFYTVNKHTMRSQDYHLVMKVLGVGMKLYNMQEYLYNYTMDERMMSRTRNWKRVIDLMWIRWDAYRRNHLPLWCYIYVLKPALTNLIPKSLMFKYYQRKGGK